MVYRNRGWQWALCVAAVWLGAAQAPALATPTVSVEVLPRIGLFHELQYRRDAADRPDLVQGQPNWRPMDAGAFMQAVHERTRNLLHKATGGHWELLTTQAPQTGYGLRRARVVVTDTRVPTGCRAEAQGRMFTGKVEHGACTALVELASNNAVPLRVWLRHGNGPDVELPPARAPEDFLIVVMGDSYASGEGTPDRPCNQNRQGGLTLALASLLGVGCDGDRPPLWMDQQCHRSFWSAGMQAALGLMEKERRQRGFTVLNVACSGASVESGMLGNYPGVVDAATLLKAHGRALGLGSLGTVSHVVATQTHVVSSVLRADAARGGRGMAELLIVSAGGNDIRFGDVVLDSVLGDQDGPRIRDAESRLGERLQGYGRRLPELAAALAAIPSELAIWLPYPDVTDINESGNLDARCRSGATQYAYLDDQAERLLSISPQERALAYRVLVQRLNQDNAVFAGDQRFRWLDTRVIDGKFRYHGWCGSANNEAVYATGGRLVRKADESQAYQRNLNGTMHPTVEAHEFFAGLIQDAVDRARREALDVGIVSRMQASGGTVSWVASPLRVELSPAARAFAGAHEICDTQRYLQGCRTGTFEITLDHDQQLARPLLAVHGETRRKFRRELPAHRVDARPPQHTGCVLVRARGGDPVACDSLWAQAGDTLRFAALDEGSGLAALTVAQRTAAGEFAVRAEAQPGGATVRVDDLPSGVLALVATATDHVGLAASQTYAVRVDRQPPAIPRLHLHGASLVAHQFARVVPAPGGTLTVVVQAADADSGVVSIEAMVGTTPVMLTTPTGVTSRLDACRHASVAGDRYELPLTVQTPGTVQVVMTAYDCARQPGSPVTLRVAHVPRHAAPPLSPAQWSGKFTPALRALVRSMTRLFGPGVPSADHDAETFGIYALWLNIADGRLDPGQVLALLIQPGTCELHRGAGQDGTVYAALLAAEECGRTALADDPDGMARLFDAILQAFAATQG